jgi:hypothetical protein
MIEEIADEYAYLRRNVEFEGEVAPAILVLAASIERAAPFSQKNAENFGHELGRALAHAVREESK